MRREVEPGPHKGVLGPFVRFCAILWKYFGRPGRCPLVEPICWGTGRTEIKRTILLWRSGVCAGLFLTHHWQGLAVVDAQSRKNNMISTSVDLLLQAM